MLFAQVDVGRLAKKAVLVGRPSVDSMNPDCRMRLKDGKLHAKPALGYAATPIATSPHFWRR